MENSKLNKNQEVIFPDKAIDIIIEFVKKYDLEKIEREMEKKISQTEIPHERRKIFESLPTCQISRTVKEIAEGKISSQKCATVLQERLRISQEKAEKLAKDLKEKVLILAESSPIVIVEEEKANKKTINYAKKSSLEKSANKSSIFSKKNIYREPIE